MSKKLIARPARPGYVLAVDHEASEKYGVKMVKWIPIKSWTDAYQIFADIADRTFDITPDHNKALELIQIKVNLCYAQHKGDPIWDLAYERWIEPSDDDEEVVR